MPWGAPPAPPRRRSWPVIIVTAFCTAVFLVSLLLNVVLLLVVGSGGDPDVISTTLTKGSSDQQIAVIPLSGVIDNGAAARFDRHLTRLAADERVKAIVIEIDSPGGTVTASDEIYHRIKRYKDDRTQRGQPAHVIVSMRSMATSGGYYAACAGDHIFAEPTTLTGNIGVLMPRYNFSGLMQKHGVQETTIVSTGADYKNLGSPFQPENERATAYLQDLADAAFDQFKKAVTTGRGTRLTGDQKLVFSGRVFHAAEAQQAGLIDTVGFPSDAYAHAAKVANLSKPTVVKYQDPAPSLLNLLSSSRVAEGNAGQSGPLSITVNGIEVQLRPEVLDDLRSPRLMYR